MKSAAQASQAWTQSAPRATSNYTTGVQQYNGDWAGATVRQQGVMQQNWIASLNTWAAHVQAVGTAGWKTATEAKSANYGTGFTAGSNNYAAAAAKVINALQTGVASLPPRGDINANLQRSNALALYMHGLKGQLGAR